MPSWVGGVNIKTVAGTVNFGDALNLSPKTQSKAYSGSGAVNTANAIITNTGINANNTIDADAFDQAIIGTK